MSRSMKHSWSLTRLRFADIPHIPVYGMALSALAAGAVPLIAPAVAEGADIEFTAQPDRRQIGLDESVAVTFRVVSGGRTRVDKLEFDAPDFELVTEYKSNQVQSSYINGQPSMEVEQKLTKVLRPKRAGTLEVRGIRVLSNGAEFKAPNIKIYVASAGAATPPSGNHSGGAVGLRGAGKRNTSPNVMIRAELNKDKLFKGEQLVVSYYLYAKVRFANLEIDKWPELKGFLKEDLDMPVVNRRLDHERVLVEGVPYDRSLLVSYAAYPLQEGKLRIDPLGTKLLYFPQGGMDDGEDPFLQFFRQLNPQATSLQSETLTVDVAPLPTEGKPASFTGAVGDFSVTASADRTEVHANEAITLKVLVQGRGNLAAIGEPKAKWPEAVELYDSKGTAKSDRGVGEKLFEMVLIPRAEGKMSLPGLEFSFFDPAQKSYVTRVTDPIELNVLAPLPGSSGATQSPHHGTEGAPEGVKDRHASPKDRGAGPSGPESLRYLKTSGDSGTGLAILGQPLWRWLYWLAGATLLILVAWVVRDFLAQRNHLGRNTGKGRKGNEASARLEKLKGIAGAARGNLPWAELSQAYEELSDTILDELEWFHPAGARSLAREDLKRIYVDENGLSVELWARLDKILEFAETVRFAGAVGGVTEQGARRELLSMVTEAQETIIQLHNCKKVV